MIKVVIALGCFDSIHLGHRKILETTRVLSERFGVKPAVFLFDGDLYSALGLSCGVVFTTEEKIDKINALGIENVLKVVPDKEFLSVSARDFLRWLDTRFDVLGYVCGEDYTFGKNAEAGVGFLKEYALKTGKFVEIIPEVKMDGERVSTTEVKNLISNGKVEKANILLGEDYSVYGVVTHGRGEGKTIGFPTANVSVNAEKTKLKSGVYAGYTVIDGKKYKAVINYGDAPTFGFKEN
ncbi:MAG: hypothetical protein MJ072_04015, partial [Clostridia bacterium]|nr:hypothetical protein [Clostridia bacterium]